MAPKTVANVHICLHAALQDAVAENLRRANPAHDAYHYSREGAGVELQHWTLAEMRAFLARAAGVGSSAWLVRDAGMYVVDLGTGLRRGELLGLRRRDLDLAHSRLN